jgi:hypothetical protein
MKLALLFLIFQAPVSMVSLADTKTSAVILKGNTCEELLTKMKALREWSTKVGDPVGPEPKCNKKFFGGYELDVTNSVPEFVREYNGTETTHDGPNCFDTALCSNHILREPSYSSPEEIDFWVKSDLCYEVSSDKEPSPGDVIVVRDKKGEAQHGFTYVTPDFSFSKNGNYHLQKFELQPMKKVYDTYGVKPGCEQVTFPDPKCEFYSQFYRCKTLEQYLSVWAPKAGAEMKPTLKAVADEECWISKVAIGNYAVPLSSEQTVKDSLEAIKKLAQEKIAEDEKPGVYLDQNARAEKMLWEGVEFRADALETQIRLIPPAKK